MSHLFHILRGSCCQIFLPSIFSLSSKIAVYLWRKMGNYDFFFFATINLCLTVPVGLATPWQLFYKSHIFCYLISSLSKDAIEFYLTENENISTCLLIFFIVTMTNLFFSSYFVNWMKVECFAFLGILLPHFSYLWSLWSLLGMVIPPCFQICTDFYILGEKKSPLWLTIASVLSSYLLCFLSVYCFFEKS